MALRLKSGSSLKLTVTDGDELGQEFIIDQESSVGNDPEADVYIKDPLVCPRHIRLYKDGNWWMAKDLLSENGSFLNGKLIKKTPVFPNSRLRIGNTSLLIDYVDEPKIETVAVQRRGEWVELPSIIAHELKNYLQFFDSGLEQLKNDTEIVNKFSGELQSFEIAGERMQELVNMLRAGCAEPRLKQLNFVDLVWEQVSMIESAAEAAGVILEVSLPDTEVEIMADANQLGRSILNILKNALEACESGNMISVMLNHSSSYNLTLIIRDTGKGMNQSTLNAMWTPMFTTKESGNGLGSFIAHAVIAKHSGRIEADSTLGKGTVIRIELPRKRSPHNGLDSSS